MLAPPAEAAPPTPAQLKARAAAARLAARDVAATRRLRLSEEAETAQAARIASLSTEHEAAERKVTALRVRLAALVASMRGAEEAPLLGLLLAPGSAADAAVAAAGLKAMTQETARELDGLQRSERAAAALSKSLGQARAVAQARHQADLARAAAIESDLGAARAATDAADRAAREAAGKEATAASQAATLHEAIAKLSAKAGGAGASGALAPVAGPVVTRFGQATETGPSAGMNYAPPASALVAAPCAGRVDFAGPFRSFGTMVILDCGRDWRFVLAGLGRVDVTPGASVRAGEAVGRMPDAEGGPGKATLYVQLRHGGVTVDPVRFLRGSAPRPAGGERPQTRLTTPRRVGHGAGVKHF